MLLTMWRGYFEHRDEVAEFEARLLQLEIAECYEGMRRVGLSLKHWSQGEQGARDRALERPQVGPYTPQPHKQDAILRLLDNLVERIRKLMAELGYRNEINEPDETTP